MKHWSDSPCALRLLRGVARAALLLSALLVLVPAGGVSGALLYWGLFRSVVRFHDETRIKNSLLVSFGRLGDIVGRRRMFFFGAGMFAIGSLLASLSQGVGQLFVGEALQSTRFLWAEGHPCTTQYVPQETLVRSLTS